MRKSVLSIITINLNNIEGLRKTCESVFSQTWDEYEWILIDGGSTDGSREYIENNRTHFDFWCSCKDNGVYDAMNKGILRATGEYILFLNSGDTLFSDETLDLCRSHLFDSDIIYGDAIFCGENECREVRYPDTFTLYHFWITSTPCHQATFIKRSLLNNSGGYDTKYRIAADYRKWIEWKLDGKTFKHLPVFVCNYMLNGISSTNLELHELERYDILHELYTPLMREQMKYIEWLKDFYEKAVEDRERHISELNSYINMKLGIKKKKSKILFDLLYIEEPEPSGVKIYSFELINSFKYYYPNIEMAVLCREPQKEYVKSNVVEGVSLILVPESRFSLLHYAQRYYKGVKKWFSEDKETCKIVSNYDICLTPFANGPLVDFSCYIPHIGVIHDLQGQKIAWSSKKSLGTARFIFRSWLKYRKLTEVIVISRHTWFSLYKFCRRRSKIIYNSISHFEYEPQKPSDFPENFKEYILDVNSFFKYKNAETLIKAFNKIKDDFPNLNLYLKGNNHPDFQTLPVLVDELNIADRVCFDREFRSNEEMAWLYKNAKLFVSPSFMEGFGYTPVEAIINQVPTIVSNIDTLKEVTRGCALMFNPHSVDDLAESIKQILDNPIPKEELSMRSESLKEYYSNKTQVLKFVEIINSIL